MAKNAKHDHLLPALTEEDVNEIVICMKGRHYVVMNTLPPLLSSVGIKSGTWVSCVPLFSTIHYSCHLKLSVHWCCCASLSDHDPTRFEKSGSYQSLGAHKPEISKAKFPHWGDISDILSAETNSGNTEFITKWNRLEHLNQKMTGRIAVKSLLYKWPSVCISWVEGGQIL